MKNKIKNALNLFSILLNFELPVFGKLIIANIRSLQFLQHEFYQYEMWQLSMMQEHRINFIRLLSHSDPKSIITLLICEKGDMTVENQFYQFILLSICEKDLTFFRHRLNWNVKETLRSVGEEREAILAMEKQYF